MCIRDRARARADLCLPSPPTVFYSSSYLVELGSPVGGEVRVKRRGRSPRVEQVRPTDRNLSVACIPYLRLKQVLQLGIAARPPYRTATLPRYLLPVVLGMPVFRADTSRDTTRDFPPARFEVGTRNREVGFYSSHLARCRLDCSPGDYEVKLSPT